MHSDKLDDIVYLQDALTSKHLRMKLADLTLEEKEKITLQSLVAILSEMGEVLNGDTLNGVKGCGAIKWKYWKKNVPPVDPNYVKTEFIDILHFVIQALLIWGCSAEEIHKRYVEKNQVNITRHNSGY